MTGGSVSGPTHEETTLLELVNRVVDRGVVISGQVTISVADIDLLYLDLRVLLCSADRIRAAQEGDAPPLLEGGTT